jgi:HEAT repeat protein
MLVATLLTLLSVASVQPSSGLADPRPAARLDALRAIDRAGTKDQAAAVAALAADADDRVQLAAIDTLLNLLLPEPVSSRRRVALVVEVRRSAGAQGAFAAGMVPVEIVPTTVFEPLARALGDLNPQVRVNAAYAIAVLATADPLVVPPSVLGSIGAALTTMLVAPEEPVRLAAARTAGRAFRRQASPRLVLNRGPQLPPQLSDQLIELMNRPRAEEIAAAMEALGLMRETRAVQAITDRFEFHRNEGPQLLALTALEALARIAHPGSADMVRAVAASPWASRNDDIALTVAFARERVLHDGSIKAIESAARQPGTQARAESYLYELRAP